MAKNLTHKLIEAHLLEGEMVPGEEIDCPWFSMALKTKAGWPPMAPPPQRIP